jgi:hypothetical protein
MQKHIWNKCNAELLVKANLFFEMQPQVACEVKVLAMSFNFSHTGSGSPLSADWLIQPV